MPRQPPGIPRQNSQFQAPARPLAGSLPSPCYAELVRSLPLVAAVIGVACGAATHRQLAPAGSPRDDGTGVLHQASVELRTPTGGASYGGGAYAGSEYGGSSYGGGRYASYQFAQSSRSRPRTSSSYLASYSVDHTVPTGAIAGTLSWSAPYRPEPPGDPTCAAPGSDRPTDAVITLHEVRRGPAITDHRLGHVTQNHASGLIEIDRCGVSPRVQAVAAIGDVGTAVLARSGPVRVVGAAENNQVLFELDLGSRGERRQFDLSTPGMITVSAGAHTGWIAVIGHPLFSVADPDGSFRITRVPAGEHTVRVWHPPPVAGAPPIVVTRRVRVAAGKTARVDLKLDPRPARRSPAAGSGEQPR